MEYCNRCEILHNKVGIHGCGKLSMVITTYSFKDVLIEMSIACAKSFRSQVDEMVIVEDSKNYVSELMQLADVYALHLNTGYSANANLGWKLASGDFIIQANSDTTLRTGVLGDLTLPGQLVTYPEIVHSIDLYNQPPGPFFCTSKAIVEKYGMFDEQSTGPEIELFGRYKNGGVEMRYVPSVVVDHVGGIPGPSFRAGGKLRK